MTTYEPCVGAPMFLQLKSPSSDLQGLFIPVGGYVVVSSRDMNHFQLITVDHYLPNFYDSIN